MVSHIRAIAYVILWLAPLLVLSAKDPRERWVRSEKLSAGKSAKEHHKPLVRSEKKAARHGQKDEKRQYYEITDVGQMQTPPPNGNLVETGIHAEVHREHLAPEANEFAADESSNESNSTLRWIQLTSFKTTLGGCLLETYGHATEWRRKRISLIYDAEVQTESYALGIHNDSQIVQVAVDAGKDAAHDIVMEDFNASLLEALSAHNMTPTIIDNFVNLVDHLAVVCNDSGEAEMVSGAERALMTNENGTMTMDESNIAYDLAIHIVDKCKNDALDLEWFIEHSANLNQSATCSGLVKDALLEIVTKKAQKHDAHMQLVLALHSEDNQLGHHYAKHLGHTHSGILTEEEFLYGQIMKLRDVGRSDLSTAALARLKYVENKHFVMAYGATREAICNQHDELKAHEPDHWLLQDDAAEEYHVCLCADNLPALICDVRHGGNLGSLKKTAHQNAHSADPRPSPTKQQTVPKKQNTVEHSLEVRRQPRGEMVESRSNESTSYGVPPPGFCEPPLSGYCCIDGGNCIDTSAGLSVDVFRLFRELLDGPSACFNCGVQFHWGWPAFPFRPDCLMKLKLTFAAEMMGCSNGYEAMSSFSFYIRAELCFGGDLATIAYKIGWISHTCQKIAEIRYWPFLGKLQLEFHLPLWSIIIGLKAVFRIVGPVHGLAPAVESLIGHVHNQRWAIEAWLSSCPSCEHNTVNWWSALDRKGWAHTSGPMIGMMRNNCDEVSCIEEAVALRKTKHNSYNADWSDSFDRKGWSKCGDGYYMTGIYRNNCNELYCIEEVECSRVDGRSTYPGACQDYNAVESAFDRQGTVNCPTGTALAGLYRNDCSKIYCIEKFHCCAINPTTSLEEEASLSVPWAPHSLSALPLPPSFEEQEDVDGALIRKGGGGGDSVSQCAEPRCRGASVNEFYREKFNEDRGTFKVQMDIQICIGIKLFFIEICKWEQLGESWTLYKDKCSRGDGTDCSSPQIAVDEGTQVTRSEENRARGRPVYASPSYWDPQKLVDGHIGTGFDYHSVDNPSFVQIDLGNYYTAIEVKVYNRQGCCPERLQGTKAYTAVDGYSGSGGVANHGALCGQVPATTTDGGVYTISCDYNVGRFVLLENAGNIELREIEVFATEAVLPPMNHKVGIYTKHGNAKYYYKICGNNQAYPLTYIGGWCKEFYLRPQSDGSFGVYTQHGNTKYYAKICGDGKATSQTHIAGYCEKFFFEYQGDGTFGLFTRGGGNTKYYLRVVGNNEARSNTAIAGWGEKFYFEYEAIFAKSIVGGPGGGTSCGSSPCPFNNQYCVNRPGYSGQCGIKEDEVDVKCGQYSDCAGVVCHEMWNGYCFARRVMTSDANSGSWGYTKKMMFARSAIGAPGGNSHCAEPSNNRHGSNCIWNDLWCVNKYGQCGILEHEVELKCGQWDDCGGAICRADYGGYCLARRTITSNVASDMWGYRKV